MTFFVPHGGTNDVFKTRSEELLDKHRRLIQQSKTKLPIFMISRILPRLKVANVRYNKIFTLNSCLKTLCRELNVGFFNTEDHFYGQGGLFKRNGLHLSSVGATRFVRILNEAVRDYLFKKLLLTASLHPGRVNGCHAAHLRSNRKITTTIRKQKF